MEEDNMPMPFGKYEGTPMCEVPAAYLDWLRGEEWVMRKWPGVWEYMADREQHINEELAEDDDD